MKSGTFLTFKALPPKTFSLVFLVLIDIVLISTVNSQPQHALPATQDLVYVANLAKAHKVPILLMFAAEDCNYCQRLEDEHLFPMTLNNDNRRRVLIQKVMIDGYLPITDFDGSKVEPGKFAFSRGVQVTPTVQLVNAQGQELTPKMIGYQSGTFYGAYLEDAIRQAYQSVHQ